MQFSPVESARFGYRIFRASADFSSETLLASGESPDIVIIRDADAKIHELYERLRGIADVHFRDTILQYRKRLKTGNLMQPTGVECEIRPLLVADEPFVESLISGVFRDYPGHYQRGVFFSQADAAAGMYDWLRNLSAKPENRVFTVFFGGNPAGILAYEIRGRVFELALAAIHPRVGLSKRNLLLIESVRLAELDFLRIGKDFFMAKTQASNLSIQKDLVRAVHCEPMPCLSTIHVHFFLHRLNEQGVSIPITGDFTATVFSHVQTQMGGDKIGAMTVFVQPDSRIASVKVILIRRMDEDRDALFFAGINFQNKTVAHASVYLR